MNRLSALFSSICILVLLWHECGENPAVFCYRISNGAFRRARARALAPLPVSTNSPVAQRTRTACSTPFSTFSALSIIPKD